MGGRFGKYGDIKRKARIRSIKPLRKKSVIPKKSREALKLVLDNGGFVKYGKLKSYDDEITFWWSDDPPTSTIGVLRLNALLVVGRIPMAGRMHKVALIPVDIRDELLDLL